MEKKSKKNAGKELDPDISWINDRISALKEFLEDYLESVYEDLFDEDKFKTRKNTLKARLPKYIEITREIEFCEALKAKMLKDYDKFLIAQEKSFASRESLMTSDLETIPDPRLWEE